jgi:hypothetical protein
MPATCPAHLIHNLITRIIFREDCRLLSSLLCIFLHFIVTSSILAPNIFLSNLFSTAYVRPSMWATKFHTHTKQEAKLWFCIS